MKKNHVIRAILAAAVIALVGLSGIALASPYGGGRQMGYANFDSPRYEEGRAPGWGPGRMAHRFEMRRIGPEAGHGRGYGRGLHHGWGGRGACWH